MRIRAQFEKLVSAAGRGGAARLVRPALIVIGLAPLIAFLFALLPALSPLAEALDVWFGFHCHRDSSRSLSLFGGVLPVCARCLGIYLGLAAGALVMRPRMTNLLLIVWVSGAALLMALDVATEALDMRPPFAGLRAATGFLLAYAPAAALVRGLAAKRCGKADARRSKPVHEAK